MKSPTETWSLENRATWVARLLFLSGCLCSSIPGNFLGAMHVFTSPLLAVPCMCSAYGSSTGGWTVWRPNFGSCCGVVWWQTMEYPKPQPWDISKECREAQHAEEQHPGHQYCQEEEENPYEGRVLLVYWASDPIIWDHGMVCITINDLRLFGFGTTWGIK